MINILIVLQTKLALHVITLVKLAFNLTLIHNVLHAILWELKIELILVVLLEHVYVIYIFMMMGPTKSVLHVIILALFVMVLHFLLARIVE